MLDFGSVNNDCNCNPSQLEGFAESSCPPSNNIINWSSITGKPSEFPPAPHTHTVNQITNLNSWFNNIVFATNIQDTNSIDLNNSGKILTANLKISSSSATGYKVPLSILSDGLIGQIPFASNLSAGILTSADWIIFNNKFNTPSGTTSQYVRGDGSIANFPSGLSPSGVAGGDLQGNYPNPSVRWVNGYSTYDSRYLLPNIIAPTTKGSATAIPSITVDAKGRITNLTETSFTGWIKPSFTTGSVLFWGATDVAQNNARFFWDNTNNVLRVTTPSTGVNSSRFEFQDGLGTTGFFGSAGAAGIIGFGTTTNHPVRLILNNNTFLNFDNVTGGTLSTPNLGSWSSNFTYSDYNVSGVITPTGFIHKANIGLDFRSTKIFNKHFDITRSASVTSINLKDYIQYNSVYFRSFINADTINIQLPTQAESLLIPLGTETTIVFSPKSLSAAQAYSVNFLAADSVGVYPSTVNKALSISHLANDPFVAYPYSLTFKLLLIDSVYTWVLISSNTQ